MPKYINNTVILEERDYIDIIKRIQYLEYKAEDTRIDLKAVENKVFPIIRDEEGYEEA